MIIISKLPFLFRTSVILTVKLAQLHDDHNLEATLPPHRSFSSCLCSFSNPRMNISLSCAATIQIKPLLCSFALTLTLIKLVHHPTTTSWLIMTKYIQFCQFRESHFNDVWHVATAIFWIIFEKSVSLDVNPISDPSRTHGYPACLSSATIWTRFFSSPLHFPLSTLHLFAEAFFFKCVEWS